MTEVVTGEGKLYLATVIDLYSRRLLGYAMGAHHDAALVVALVVAALNLAGVTRGGNVTGVIFHSDRGSEYGSAEFARACARWQVRQSMGRVGSCFDNAVAEATLLHHQGRVRAPPAVPYTSRGAAEDRDMDHRLLQPAPASLRLRLALTHRLRTNNGRRPHRSLGLQPPRSDRPPVDLTHQRIKRRPVLGGLITEYERAA
jgi:transposase InsO family protein